MDGVGIDLGPAPDWTECSSARAWARADLPFETLPTFGSKTRSMLHQAIADDKAEVTLLEESIRRIALKIQELKHRVSMNLTRVAPIRLMPNETLSAIFLEWMYLRDLPEYYSSGELFLPPSGIMKVCRRWAACAASTPAIWTHGRHRIDGASLDRARIVKTYFDRAGSRNLAVEFGGRDELGLADQMWREVMEPSLYRLEDLTITETRRHGVNVRALDGWPDRKFVMFLTVCTRLTKLCLHGIDFPKSASQTPIFLPTVREIHYAFCTGNPPICFPGLLACEIDECSLSGYFAPAISANSPLLETVRLFLTDTESEIPQLGPIFPSLKNLEIEYHDDMSIPECFFKGPNLSRIELRLYEGSFSDVVQAISLSSSSALTSLILNMSSALVSLADDEIQIVQDWMVQAHNLVELQLIFHWDNESIVEYGMNMYIDPLLATYWNPPCYPHLKHITIKGQLGLEAPLRQLLRDRATDAELVEAGFPACGVVPGIVQRPCLLTILDSQTLPDMKSVGLVEFLRICQEQKAR